MNKNFQAHLIHSVGTEKYPQNETFIPMLYVSERCLIENFCLSLIFQSTQFISVRGSKEKEI